MQIRERNEIFLLFISIRVFFALHARKKSETNRNLCQKKFARFCSVASQEIR